MRYFNVSICLKENLKDVSGIWSLTGTAFYTLCQIGVPGLRWDEKKGISGHSYAESFVSFGQIGFFLLVFSVDFGWTQIENNQVQKMRYIASDFSHLTLDVWPIGQYSALILTTVSSSSPSLVLLRGTI